MVQSIPASAIVNVTPNVLNAGGAGLSVIGLILTDNVRVPIGSVTSFANAPDMANYFGATDQMATLAEIYFGGFTNSNIRPGSVLVAQYPTADVAAWLRGGSMAAVTLATLQGYSGEFTVVVDGVNRDTGALDFSAVTSFSDAATAIQSGFAANSPASASVTGTVGGRVTASCGATTTGTGSGTNLTVTSTTGVIHIGALLAGTGVPAGTYIVSQTSGATGGDGVYVTSQATTAASAAITVTSNILDVTVLSRGLVRLGDVLSGTGVSGSTTVLAQLSGAVGGVGTYTISTVQQFASTTVTVTSPYLNVTAVGSGALSAHQPISGTGIAGGTTIAAQISGTPGGIGLYTISIPASTASETITATLSAPTAVFDTVSQAFIITSGTTGAGSTIAYGVNVSGNLATHLNLTQSNGAITSQGAAEVNDPAAFMDAIVELTQDWATFMTTFNPDGHSGTTVRLAFSEWTSGQNNRYAYVVWDTDISPSEANPATSSLGYLIRQSGFSGSCPVWVGALDYADETAPNAAAFICGVAASIDFTQLNGRTTFAFRNSEAGVVVAVTDETTANNLIANGYNYYGSYATAASEFEFLYPGSVSGPFQWMDSYINEIWLNNALQLALMNLLTQVKSIPYNQQGYALISASCRDPVNAALNFGAIRSGVTLSNAQKAEINSAAGTQIDTVLSQRGWVLQVLDASPQVRQQRGSPPITLWYTDGESVQRLNIASVLVQ